MKIQKLKTEQGTEFKGLFLVTPEKFTDQRGFFMKVGTKMFLIKLLILKSTLFRIIIQLQ